MPASSKLVQRTTAALALLLFGALAVAAAVVGTDERVAADAPSGTGFGPVLNGASLRSPVFLTGFSGPVA